MEGKRDRDERATQLGKDLVNEWHTSENTLHANDRQVTLRSWDEVREGEKSETDPNLALAPQESFLESFPYDESTVIERRSVFGEPGSDDALPGGREEVGVVPERGGEGERSGRHRSSCYRYGNKVREIRGYCELVGPAVA